MVNEMEGKMKFVKVGRTQGNIMFCCDSRFIQIWKEKRGKNGPGRGRAIQLGAVH